jgi:protein TonB
MKKLCLNLLNILVFVFIAQTANAQISTKGMTLNGIASYEKLRKEHYLAALYLEEPSNFPDYVLAMPGKKVMDIRITIDDWSTRSFTSAWTEAMLINNSGAAQNKNKEFIMEFGKLLKDDLKKGDRLLIAYTPNIGSSIVLNGTTLLTTSDDGVFNLLLNTWIGPRPYSSDFKKDLLNFNNNAELVKRHQETTPSAKRVTAIAAWAPKKEEPQPEPPKPEAKKPEAPKPEVKKEIAQPKPAEPAKPAAVASVPAATPAPAPVAATPPPPAPVAAAKPAVNSSEDLFAAFRANVLKQTYRNTKYPERSINLKQEGVIILKLKINRAGKVVNTTEEQTSEFISLNKAAEVAVKRSQPYPAPPDGLKGETFEISVPFNFKL